MVRRYIADRRLVSDEQKRAIMADVNLPALSGERRWLFPSSGRSR
jgi:hypothetical protein